MKDYKYLFSFSFDRTVYDRITHIEPLIYQVPGDSELDPATLLKDLNKISVDTICRVYGLKIPEKLIQINFITKID